MRQTPRNRLHDLNAANDHNLCQIANRLTANELNAAMIATA